MRPCQFRHATCLVAVEPRLLLSVAVNLLLWWVMQKSNAKKKSSRKIVTPKSSIATTAVRPIKSKKTDVSPLAPTVMKPRPNAIKTQLANRPSERVRAALRRPNNLEINKNIGYRTMKALRLNNNLSKKASSRAFGIWLMVFLMLCGAAGVYTWMQKNQVNRPMPKTSLLQKSEIKTPKLKQRATAVSKTKVNKIQGRAASVSIAR